MTIIRSILQSKELKKGKEVSLDEFFVKIPFMEIEWSDGETGADKFAKLTPPRYMKTHLPHELWKKQLAKHPNLKVIQTMRNPKDTLVSFYHHARSDSTMGAFNGTWDQYFQLFKEKKLPWGDYFEHNAAWYKFNQNRDNSLILRYEEMKKDTKAHVVKIAKFIGHDISDKVADLTVEKSQVKTVSKTFTEMFSDSVWKKERSPFVRKGEVGDWVNYFSKEQVDYVDAKYKEYLEPLGIVFEDSQ